ncbi:MAG: autotransporter-associated beta strand repeat-containing protein [Luteolibacter sp.]|uniref:beta strand repeat-containing protein n=1 Tax=Luteolibacter sp. TaxID=1962973 RepID=UPI003265FFC5
MKPNRRSNPFLRVTTLGFTAAVMAFGPQSGSAAPVYWDGSTGNWDDLTKWSTAAGAATPDPLAIPTTTESAVFDITSNNSVVSQTVYLNGGQLIGTLTVNNSGRTTLSGGISATPNTTDVLTSFGNVSVGVAAGNKSMVTLSSDLTALNLSVGGATTGAGAIYQSGGAVSLTDTTAGSGTASSDRIFSLGATGSTGTAGYGYYGMTGGTLTSRRISIGARANGTTGVMEVSGASTLATSNTGLNIARGNGSGTNLGLLNVTGGTVTFAGTSVATLEMGYQAGDFAVLNVGGGVDPAAVTQGTGSTATTAVGLSMATLNATGTNAVNLLTNGTLTVSTAFGATANATALINFNGGTLKATATNAGVNFLNSANIDGVTVFSGGGSIDNNGTSITVGKVLAAPTGSGVQTVTVSTQGAGYIGAPVVQFTGGTGRAATAVANMVDDGSGNGTYKVGTITITSPGDFTVLPTAASLTGGSPVTAATAAVGTTGVNASGGMGFTGAGTTTLSGANSYTGSTTVGSGSTVIVSGSFASPITKAGAGLLNVTASQGFTGAAAVTAGTLKLSGTGAINSSSGVSINGPTALLLQDSSASLNVPITVTQGTLDGTTTVGGAVTVGAGTGGIVANGDGGTGTGTLTLGSSLTFNGAGSLALSPIGGATLTTAPLTVTGALTVPVTANTITVNVTPGTPLVNGSTYNLIGYGSFVGNVAAFQKGTGFSSRQTPTFSSAGGFIKVAIAGDSPKWTGALNSTWSTATLTAPKNWKLITAGTATDYLQGDIVLFDDTATTTTPNISAAYVSPVAVTFDNSTKAYTLGSSNGFGIAGAGNLTKSGTNTLTILTNNTFTGPTTISAGTLQIGNGSTDGSIASSSAIINNGSLVYNLAGNDQSYPNVISGTGGLTVKGLGTLTLNAANTFSGGITLDENGVLNVGVAGASGAVTNSLTFPALSAGRLLLNGNSLTVSSLTGGADGESIENFGAAAATLTVDGTVDTIYGGVLQNGGVGTLGLTKNGTSMLTLAGNNSYSGTTSVTGGTLAITGALGNTPVALSAGTLSLQAAGAISQNTLTITGGTLTETVDNAISGSAGVNPKVATTLSAPNNYSGDTTFNVAGTVLTITHPLAAGTGRLAFAAGSNNSTAQLHIDGGGSISMPIGLGGSTGLVNTIDVNNNGSGTNGVISLDGTVSNFGNATLNVTGANGYNLRVNSISATGGFAGAIVFNPTTASLAIGAFNNATNFAKTLTLDGTSSGNAVTGVISNTLGVLSLTKSNSSTWTLTNANTYTGTTTVSAGTLQIGNGGTSGSIPSTAAVVDNATLAFNRSDSLTVANIISGAGVVVQAGTGTTTLSGANTYTGNTIVNAGTLEITSSYLENSADVLIAAGGKLQLSFAGTDTVDELTIAGVAKAAGTYGATGSGAAHIDDTHFSGTGTLTVTTGPSGAYDAWASSKGLTGANNGATQDPDFDGISNVLEFVLNGNPLASDTGKLPISSQDASNFYFDFDRRDDSVAEVTLTFEYGTTLASWPSSVAIPSNNNLVTGPPVTVTDNGGGTHHLKVTVAKAGNTQLFGRLKAVK